eukprot:201001-Pyramimonas_sp.AAC.1
MGSRHGQLAIRKAQEHLQSVGFPIRKSPNMASKTAKMASEATRMVPRQHKLAAKCLQDGPRCIQVGRGTNKSRFRAIIHRKLVRPRGAPELAFGRRLTQQSESQPASQATSQPILPAELFDDVPQS